MVSNLFGSLNKKEEQSQKNKEITEDKAMKQHFFLCI